MGYIASEIVQFALASFVVFAACSSDGPSSSPVDATQQSGDSTVLGCKVGETQELTLRTDDGVALAADLYVSSTSNSPAVILLHMIPPSNSKANYPPAFAQALQSRGITVLNVNRRGAPGSEGVAVDAYTGPSGKLDAKAAYDFLTSQCGASSYAIVGASNGTTTAIDFAVFAAEADGIDAPEAIVALSGGPYTESQNRISDKLSSLPNAAYFAYPESEAAWNIGIRSLNSSWLFQSYSPGAHGTGLLSSNPEIVGTIVEFLAGHLL